MWGRARPPVRLSRRLSSGLDSWGFAGEGARATRFDQLAKNCLSGLKVMLEPKHGFGNRVGFWAGKAHNANSPAAGRRGDGDDGVVEIHCQLLLDDLAPTSRKSGEKWGTRRFSNYQTTNLPNYQILFSPSTIKPSLCLTFAEV